MPGCFSSLELTPNRIEQARQRRAAGRGYIDLTSSNPTHQGWLFPPDVLRQATERYWTNRRYDPDPHGVPESRQAIASYYKQRCATGASNTRQTISPDAIYITASTSEAYGLLFALLTDPGDNILAPDVTYPLFDYLAEIHHVELRTYHMDESHSWHIQPASLLAQADSRTRAVLLISPHNPTGMVLQSPLAVLNDLGLPLICDEVFASFPYRVAHVPPVMLLHPTLPVFLLNGISKMFALPDMKLGWIALNSVAYARYGERLELLNDTFLGANMLTQTMLPDLLAQGNDFVAAMVAHVQTNLTHALERFTHAASLQANPPDGGYYLFPSVDGWYDEEDLVLYLLDHGVLVHPGFFYGDVPGTHIMLSALTQQEDFARGIERLCNALDR